MNNTQITYLVFGIVITLALIFDLSLLSKKNTVISIKAALKQTVFLGIACNWFFRVCVVSKRSGAGITIPECLPDGMEFKY